MDRSLLVSLLAIALASSPAAAGPQRDARWSGHVGGSVSVPFGDAADEIDTGWGVALGTAFTPSAGPLGVMLEGGFHSCPVSEKVLNALKIPNGNAYFWPITLNAVLARPRKGPTGVYFVGGGGAYVLHASSREPTYDAGVIDDPWWWGWRYPGVSPAGRILGSVTKTKFGLDGGGGITIDTGNETEIYLEVRYHYVFLDELTLQFVPITIGLRW